MDQPIARSRSSRLIARLAEALRALATPVCVVPVDLGAAPCAERTAPLHRCARCRSRLVCPTDWSVLDDEHWTVELRCGDCGHRRTAAATNRESAAFELRLARDAEAIAAAADRLDRERMGAEADCLARALADDLIDAADFAC